MSCNEFLHPQRQSLWRRVVARLSLGVAAGLAACSAPRHPEAPAVPEVRPPADAGQARHQPKPGEAAPPLAAARLGPPKPVRTAAELRAQAALRLVAANPERIYLGEVPDVLLAIPVLEIELNANGSVKHIHVLRKPGQALDTLDLAIEAVHRAAPFGDVSAMPKPWKFSETFLFNDERRFKPRTLDL